MEINKTVIIGAGALGLLYGTHLLDAGKDVYYLMDAKRYTANLGREYYKNGKPYMLPMVPAEEACTADLVIVAVKYNGLNNAIESMAGCVGSNTVIMSVLNGIVSEDLIAERYGSEHIIYCVAHGMDAVRSGNKLSFAHEGELRIGGRDERQSQNAAVVKTFLEQAGISCRIDDNIMHRLWSKFMLNVGVNQTCMVYETNYGGVLHAGEANRCMVAAMRETISLARAEGITLSEDDLNEYLGILASLSPQGMPSMRQDALAKRPSEVEMFSGTVLRLAKKHNLYMPTNAFLYEHIHEMEKAY